MLVLQILVFIVSLIILIKAADYFTHYSEKLGLALGIPQFIVGVTIVSIGTSLPELASSLAATFKNSTEIVAGNVIGSNIANILLIIGLTTFIAGKIEVKRDILNLDIPLLAGGAVMLLAMIMWDGKVTYGEGVIALLTYLLYLHYSYKFREKEGEENKANLKREKVKFKWIAILVISAFLIYLGADYLINSVKAIAQIFKVNPAIIALTAVALGTSLPELFVSLSAVKRKNYEVALGNVFGSNIFNECMVLGLPAIFKTLLVSPKTISIALPFFIGSTLLFIISGMSRRIHRWEGGVYLLLYALFLGKLLNLF